MQKKVNNHLAEGEVTGHFHAATGKDTQVFEDVYDDASLHLETGGKTDVTHQEHATINLPAGTKFRTGQVLEYDPAEEEAREVRD